MGQIISMTVWPMELNPRNLNNTTHAYSTRYIIYIA